MLNIGSQFAFKAASMMVASMIGAVGVALQGLKLGGQETVNGAMKILILMALFSAIAAASYRADRQEQPKPAA
ncbi:MAG TPA: hypothetical protein VIY51_01700 [Xanthobacteraceae bacterium]